MAKKSTKTPTDKTKKATKAGKNAKAGKPETPKVFDPEAPATETPQAEKPAAPKAKTASAKKKTSAKPKKVSALDAAAKVLGETDQPLNCQEMIEKMATKGYWTSPGGQTPSATLYSAILREINVKGKQARFRKTERGKFALAANA